MQSPLSMFIHHIIQLHEEPRVLPCTPRSITLDWLQVERGFKVQLVEHAHYNLSSIFPEIGGGAWQCKLVAMYVRTGSCGCVVVA